MQCPKGVLRAKISPNICHQNEKIILALSCLLLAGGCGEKKKESQPSQPAKREIQLQKLWARKFVDGYRTNSFDPRTKISVSTIENFPEKLPPDKGFVWMDVEFLKIDGEPIDEFFNHTDVRDYIREHGGESRIHDEREKWVAFTVSDKNGDFFRRCLSSKDDNVYVSIVLSLKRGDRLRLGGRVSKITTDVPWFFVDSIYRL